MRRRRNPSWSILGDGLECRSCEHNYLIRLESRFMTRVASFVVLLAIIVATSILFWRVMSSFFVPLFLSLLLVVMFRPVYEWLLAKLQKPRVSAVLTVTLVTLLVLLPAVWLVSVAASQSVNVFTHSDELVQKRLERLRDRLNLELPPAFNEFRTASHDLERLALIDDDSNRVIDETYVVAVRAKLQTVHEELTNEGSPVATKSLENAITALVAAEAQPVRSMAFQARVNEGWASIQTFRVQLLGGPMRAWLKETVNPTDAQLQSLKATGFNYARKWVLTISGTTLALLGKLVLGGVIVVISLYFFLLDGPKMTKTVMWLSPLDDHHEEELLAEFGKVSRAVVIATLLSALVQAILAAIGFWVAGLPSVVLLMVLTAVFAMVPFFGAAAVWVPAAIFLYIVEGRLGAAIGLGIYGAVIVSSSDNIIKPWVLHGQSNLHPLFALLSVLGGVQTLGPMGILVGPMVVAFMQTLLKILHRELTTMDSDAIAETTAAAIAETPS